MPEWSSGSDWDGAQSENGIVHESVTNTDHDNAAHLKQGYSASSPVWGGSDRVLWPLNEDSGDTAYDFSGNGYDTTGSGTYTVNNGAILGTTGWRFQEGYLQSNAGASNSFTFTAWVYVRDATEYPIWSGGSGGASMILGGAPNNNGFSGGDNNLRYGTYNGSSWNVANYGATIPTNEWHMVTGVTDAGSDQERLYLDGSLVATEGGGSSWSTSNLNIGREPFSGNNINDTIVCWARYQYGADR
jgi:hypothetical protein